MYNITAVGLGPGDPDLITVKGLKKLQEADVVYFPASKIEADNVKTFSGKILDAYNLKCELKPIHFPMTGKGRERIYDAAYNTLLEAAKTKKVVIANEGDILFYSTYGYIQNRANRDGIKCETVPGIPAFVAASSAIQHPVVDGNKNFRVLARPSNFEEVKFALRNDSSVVIMKMKVLDGWYDFLKEMGRDFFYVEHVGCSDEYLTSNIEDLKDRKIPYFSMLIFYSSPDL